MSMRAVPQCVRGIMVEDGEDILLALLVVRVAAALVNGGCSCILHNFIFLFFSFKLMAQPQKRTSVSRQRSPDDRVALCTQMSWCLTLSCKLRIQQRSPARSSLPAPARFLCSCFRVRGGSDGTASPKLPRLRTELTGEIGERRVASRGTATARRRRRQPVRSAAELETGMRISICPRGGRHGE